MPRTQQIFKQNLQPRAAEITYKLELVAAVSLGPDFAGARPRTYDERGDVVIVDRTKAIEFLTNRWCLLVNGEPNPWKSTPVFTPAAAMPASGWISHEPKPDLKPRKVKLIRAVFVSKHHPDAQLGDVITVNAQLARLLISEAAAELMPGQEPVFEMAPAFVLQ